MGQGSFAKVNICSRKSTKEKFAVKSIAKGLVNKNWHNQHLIAKEISTMRNMSHPNIVPLYAVYESDRYVHLVMKLLRGGELLNHILLCENASE